MTTIPAVALARSKQRDGSMRTRRHLTALATYALLTFGALAVLVPLFWMVSTSLKHETDLFILPPQIWPVPANWRNYVDVWTIQPLTLYFANTAFITVLAMLGEIVTCSLVAYGFARFRFPGRHALFMVMLGTMMLPGIITLIPTFLIWRDVQRIDTFTPLTIGALFAWGPAYIFLLRQFFMTIPREIEEAAVMDGANPLQLFAKIMLPLVKPALLAIAVLSFTGNWNNFQGPLIYINSPGLYPVILALYSFSESLSKEAPKWHYMMAMTVIMSVPIVALYFVAQRYFIEGLTVGSVKG